MRTSWLSVVTSILVLAIATMAHAVSITLDVVGANWTNVVGGANVDLINTDGIAGFEEIRWGGSTGSKSGYRFDGAAPPAFNVNDGVQFSLGDFTHFNFPIQSGTSISSAQLDISANLTIDGTSMSEGPFTFSFLHNETTNSCSPQPNCANDIVSFVNSEQTDTFFIGGQELTLELLGFSRGDVFTEQFSTTEGMVNTASLEGIFRAPTTDPVPEPGSMILLGSGLVGLAGYGRKRRKS